MHFTALLIARYKFCRNTKSHLRTPSGTTISDLPVFPGVSIIKPLVGVDCNLASNLETFFTLDYPQYELLFCVHEENDPAALIVHALQKKYPSVASSLFVGGEKVGVNPKVNNMQPAYKEVKYDLLLISDSGIRMRPDTLRDMVNHMSESVGLVHQMPFVFDAKDETFSGRLERVYFGTQFARIYLTADLYRINCCTGMSVLVRKHILDDSGGLEPLGKYLGEDYILAQTVKDKGYRFTLASQPAWQNAGDGSVTAFHARLTRWTRLRTAMVPTTLLLEPMSECLPLGLLAAISVNVLFRWDPIIFFLLHCLAWFLLDYLLITTVGGYLSFSKIEFLLAWAFRSFAAPYVFAGALRDPVIRWRTGLYRLQWGGTIQEVDEQPKGKKAKS